MYGMVFNGFIYGYTSPALPGLLHTKDGPKTDVPPTIWNGSVPLKITDVEASWMSSITNLGYPIGGILNGILIGMIGKRWTAIFGQGLSHFLGHLLIMSASSVEYLYIGRFLCGICQGFCNCLTYLYVLSLCHGRAPKTKAIAGLLPCLIGNSGTLFTYMMGCFLNWRQLAGLLSLLTVPYIIGIMAVVPKDSQLLDSLDFERKDSYDVILTSKKAIQDESFLVQIRDSCSSKSPVKQLAKEVKDSLTSVPLWTGLIMMLFYQFGGYNVITFYSSTIISASATG